MDDQKQPTELERTACKQEQLRRAIEVGVNALSKLYPFNDESKELLKELQDLTLEATKRLRRELTSN